MVARSLMRLPLDQNLPEPMSVHCTIDDYDDRGDAYSVGCEKYDLGNFSLQQIGEQPAQLGILTAVLQ